MTTSEPPWFVHDAVDLLRRMDTVHLASVSGQGVPLASVAPFVIHDGALWVFVSALAGHTSNLRARGDVSLLVVRDEADCDDAFARPRLTLSCRVEEEPRTSTRWTAVLDRMVASFGETAAVVRELPDFALFGCVPVQGQLVGGFARAAHLDAGAVRAALDLARSAGRS